MKRTLLLAALAAAFAATSAAAAAGLELVPAVGQPITNDSEYGGTPITLVPTKCGTSAGCTVEDADIQNELNAQVNAGNLPSPKQAFGGPVTIYHVLFPDNVTICRDGDCSGVKFCAYHGTAYHGPGSTNPFMYTVIPHGSTTSGSLG